MSFRYLPMHEATPLGKRFAQLYLVPALQRQTQKELLQNSKTSVVREPPHGKLLLSHAGTFGSQGYPHRVPSSIPHQQSLGSDNRDF